MIKNKLTKGILSLALLSNLAFGYNDGWDTPSTSVESGVQEQNYSNWVDTNTVNKKWFGVGYAEGTFGVTFGVNTTLGVYSDESTNWYSMFDFSEYRLGFSQGYDLFQNYGVKGLQLIPFAGFSVDTSSADLGFFAGIRSRINVYNNWGLSLGYKYYISKPTEGSNDKEEDTKGYVFSNIEYRF